MSIHKVVMKVDVLAVVGSKRREGNTASLVAEVTKSLENHGLNVKTINLDDYRIEGCRGCEACSDDSTCIIEDGMMDIYPLISEADAIVLASPTYFYNVTSDMKSFIDRTYCLMHFHPEDRSVWTSENEIHGTKHAVTVAVCEQKDIADMGFTSQAMELSLQALGYRVIENIRALHMFGPDDASSDADTLQSARNAGIKLARMLSMTRNLKSEKNER